MKYRADIDGLRAVAVCSVIFFHAGFSLFRGGYVGVDIFFVISGFLITKISLDAFDTNNFRVLEFFERRARRILPALILVCAATTFASMALMDPLQLTRYFESLSFTFLFSSNFYFLFQSGYFDTASEFKPLLHTWSLAVEEQYYLLFPFVFLLLARLHSKKSLFILSILFFSSIVFAQILIQLDYLDEAFYLLPTRIWQILIGTFCAVFVRAMDFGKLPKLARQTLSLTGLLMVLIAVMVFNNNTPSPGAHALIPTVGAGLIILFSSSDTVCGKILGLKPFVFVGLISYSAYLWHQPIFALSRLHLAEEPSAIAMVILCAAIIPLSYVSWKYIEKPCRSHKVYSTKRYVSYSAGLVVTLLIVGVAGSMTHGFLRQLYPTELADRYSSILRAVDYDYLKSMHDNSDCQFWAANIDSSFLDRFENCETRYGQAVVVIGDSHGMNFYNMVAKTNQRQFVVGLVQGGCRPYGDRNKSCQYEEVADFLSRKKNSVASLLYHQSGSHIASNFDPTNPYLHSRLIEFQIDSDNVTKVLDYLKGLSTTLAGRVTWVGPFKEYMGDPMLAARSDKALSFSPNSPELIRRFEEHMRFRNLSEQVNYVPFSSLYSLPSTVLTDGCFLFRDRDHFSRCGENLAAAEMIARGSLTPLLGPSTTH